MFMHNGQVSGFKKIKRQLIQYLHEDLFGSLQGTTDSEHSFMLFLHLLLFAKKDEQKDSRSSSKKKQQKKGCRDSTLSIMPGDHIEESNNHCLSSSPKNDSNTTTATKKIKSIKKVIRVSKCLPLLIFASSPLPFPTTKQRIAIKRMDT